MLGAYYTKGYDTHSLFNNLNIARTADYEKYLNQHHVIYINFSRMPFQRNSYASYINSIYNKLYSDISTDYGIETKYDSLEDLLIATNDSFIFVLDEWDSIFYEDFMGEENKKSYLKFLNGLLKDQPRTAHHSAYVELAYMTGVLPIAKYSSGSALNVFKEYSFLDDHTYDAFFGFSDEEVHKLCEENKSISYDELKYWYDGYKLQNGQSLFNPRSVVNALTDGVCLNYWTETGPMNTEGCAACEIANCIGKANGPAACNVDKVRDDMAPWVHNV